MKKFIEEYWFGGFLLLISVCVTYIIYVHEHPTRTQGCSYIDHVCIKSHIETSERYYGKRCDESKQVEVPCDCITYHWFWGDQKDY